MEILFNRNPLVLAGAIEQPSEDLIKNTPSLWQADLDTALLYGGELTRAALGAMNIRGDKKYVLVDTKVHMLMPGQCPAIPGWHTDGIPRRKSDGTGWSPLGDLEPSFEEQEWREKRGDKPRFHLLVTGEGCLTEFMTKPAIIRVDENLGNSLYAEVTKQVNEKTYFVLNEPIPGVHSYGAARFAYPNGEDRKFAPSCTAVEWDWWNLHQGIIATKREWRFLIRVTESDYHEPQPRSNLHNIIRTQQMVYTPMEFGW